METQYKNPHEMSPYEMLDEAEKHMTRGDYGASFYYATVARALEGVFSEDVFKEASDELKEFDGRTSFIMHYSWSRIQSDLEIRTRQNGLKVTCDNKKDLLERLSPHYQTHKKLLDTFEDQLVLQGVL